MLYRLIASVLACVCLPAFAQPTCNAALTTPATARDEARLKWDAVTQNTDGTAVGSPLTYKVYRATGAGAATVQCQTTALTVSLLAQPVGVQNYTITVQFPGSLESFASNVATKTVTAPRPNPPANLTLLEQVVAFIKRLFSHFA